MVKKVEVVKLTASEISSLIVYKLQIGVFTNPFLNKAVQRGRLAHSRNGFNNTQMFSRFYKLNGHNIKIVGIPDRVDNDFVYEFKTFSSPVAKKRNEKVGLIQILVYEFLTGLKGKLVMYNIKEDKITNEFVIPFKSKKFKVIIQQAVSLKKLELKFKNDFASKQRVAQNKIFV